MKFKFKVGDEIIIKERPCGWEAKTDFDHLLGKTGKVIDKTYNGVDSFYSIRVERVEYWWSEKKIKEV